MRSKPMAYVLDVFGVSDKFCAVERVVARAIRIVRGLERDRGCGGPIDAMGRHVPARRRPGECAQDRGITDDSPRSVQHVSFEIVCLDSEKAGLVEMVMDAAQSIGSALGGPDGGGLGWSSRVAVFEPLAHRQFLADSVARPQAD